MEDFLEASKKFALDEQKRTGMPVFEHIKLSSEVGQRLAKILGADKQIVEAGTYLMDCMIGQALMEGRLKDHVSMSEAKASELLREYNMSPKDGENIRHCVKEHHGAKKFYSLESEICCNADCYRFISIKGFSYALRFLRDMPFEDLVRLLEEKVNEKWNALTLKECKEELSPQYEIIKKYLELLKS